MALVLHKVLLDGSIVHEDFSRESWERALEDRSIRWRWGHRPNDCEDILPEESPAASGRLNGMGSSESSGPEAPGDSVRWPPEAVMTADQLSELSGLCRTDCLDILIRRLSSEDAAKQVRDGIERSWRKKPKNLKKRDLSHLQMSLF